MQKMATCLWFNGNAEEAANFYVSVFPDARITDFLRHGEAGPGPVGSVLTVSFELMGSEYIGLNGGSNFSFTPAISIFVKCETQDEVDTYWDKLLEGGQAMACGWLTDRFGVTWQIVPAALMKMIKDEEHAKTQRVMRAMMQMIKLDLNVLEKAYRGE